MTKIPAESFTAEELEKDTKDLEEVIKRGLEKYAEEKAKGNIMQRLEKTMNYIPQPAG